jgi:hypothetical protein
MIRSVPPSVHDISTRGRDLQEQHARRLLLSGYDLESAATLSRLPLAAVRQLAATVIDEFAPKAAPP